MNLTDLDDKVAAAVIAAAGTVIGALIQLRAAWRKEVAERARGTPVTKKSRRGPVWAVALLLIAAAVGGFALSQTLERQADREVAAVRGELQTQLKEISATAQRLERATQHDRGSAEHAVDDRTHAENAVVTAAVGPCRGAPADAAAAACAEAEALRVTLCATVPSGAVVTQTALFVRPEDARQPWRESRVGPAQDVGRARFADKPFERADDDQSKQVCALFMSWDGERAYSARLVVTHVLPTPAGELSSVSLMPTSAAGR